MVKELYNNSNNNYMNSGVVAAVLLDKNAGQDE